MNSKYVKHKLADLKAKLKKRRAKVTGRKKELVERLFSSNLQKHFLEISGVAIHN